MSLHEQVHMTRHNLQRHHPPPVLAGLRADQLLTPDSDRAAEDRTAVLRAPHHVIPKVVHPASANPHLPAHAGDYTHSLRQTTRFPCHPKTALPSRGA
jgi:hypothetical protein